MPSEPELHGFPENVRRVVNKGNAWLAGMTKTLERMTGFAALQTVGKTANWTYGEGVPVGFSPASENVVVSAAGGRITWATDTLTPQCAGSNCAAVQLLLDGSGIFFKIASGQNSASCWSVAHGSVAGLSRIGLPSGFTLYGHFSPMKREGRNELVTSTYSYGSGRTATEFDTISLATRLPIKAVVHVTGSSENQPLRLVLLTPGSKHLVCNRN